MNTYKFFENNILIKTISSNDNKLNILKDILINSYGIPEDEITECLSSWNMDNDIWVDVIDEHCIYQFV